MNHKHNLRSKWFKASVSKMQSHFLLTDYNDANAFRGPLFKTKANRLSMVLESYQPMYQTLVDSITTDIWMFVGVTFDYEESKSIRNCENQ